MVDFTIRCPECDDECTFDDDYVDRNDPFDASEGMCCNCAVEGYANANQFVLSDEMSVFGIRRYPSNEIELVFSEQNGPLTNAMTFSNEEAKKIGLTILRFCEMGQ